MMTISAKTRQAVDEKPTSITPAASWTHGDGDTEAKREHDFANWLHEMVLASEMGSPELVAFIAQELTKMYRAANRKV